MSFILGVEFLAPLVNLVLVASISFVNFICAFHQSVLWAPVLRKKKNDSRSHIPFHSLSSGKVEEISELQYHLIWSKVNSCLPGFFFPFYKKKQKHCFWWEGVALLGSVSVADKKGRGLKVTAKLYLGVLEFRRTFLSKNRNTVFFFFFWQLFISIKEKPQWPIIMKGYILHNLVTGLLTFRGHINIYWRHNKYLFHFIKNCMETADRLTQFDLAMNMIIVIWLSVLLEVISYIAKICVFGLLQNYCRVLRQHNRKHLRVSCMSHINCTIQLSMNHQNLSGY